MLQMYIHSVTDIHIQCYIYTYIVLQIYIHSVTDIHIHCYRYTYIGTDKSFPLVVREHL
jgi:hypothetical protein